MPILNDKNYQQLNDRIRSFTVLNWYCKTVINDAPEFYISTRSLSRLWRPQ
jgi:hypothetical protein